MKLCETGSLIRGGWFREVRKLSGSGHQTSIITTHPDLSLPKIAARMFARWSQENFFKYMIANFDFDKMIEYGTQEIKNKADFNIPNPAYVQLSYKIKKAREKKARLEAQLYRKIDPENAESMDKLKKTIDNEQAIIEQINDFADDMNKFMQERKSVPSGITLDKLPPETNMQPTVF
ncbi:MAG: hypothetical protein LBG96_02500 [Tannerella sp.]|jgi:hypothetical protein|nr:hypothetical protein [Tannerella sp.]